MTPHSFSLRPFLPAESHLRIEGNISRSSKKIVVDCVLLGPISEVVVPALARIPVRTSALWEGTCFEFFLAGKNFDQYWEFNLSPAGHWNVYRFESYRKGMVEETAFRSLPFTVDRRLQALRYSLEFDPEKIIPANRALMVAVSAVIKFRDEGITYWALTHPGPRPDFHHREGFILEL